MRKFGPVGAVVAIVGAIGFWWHAPERLGRVVCDMATRGRWSGVVSSIYTTSVRSSAPQPGVVAYAALIRTSSTDLALYPGYEGPEATSLPRGPEMVPPIAHPRLLGAFNSGFYESDEAVGVVTTRLGNDAGLRL